MLRNIHKTINKLKEEHSLINYYLYTYYDESAEEKYLDFFTRITNKVLDGEQCSIFINDPENETVWFEVGTGTGTEKKQISVPKTGTIVGRVIESGKTEIHNNMQAQEEDHKKLESTTGLNIHNAIFVPVKSLDREQITGVIRVVNKGNKGSFGEDDQKWLEDIAHNIQFNIEHISLHRGSLSITDKTFSIAGKLFKVLIIILAFLAGGITLYLLALILAATSFSLI